MRGEILRLINYSVALVLFLQTTNFCWAFESKSKPIDISKFSVQNINKLAMQLADSQNHLSINDVLDENQKWLAIESENLVLGLDSSTLWIKFSLLNSLKEAKKVFLELQPVFLEDIQLFDSAGNLIDITGSNYMPQHLDSLPTLRTIVPPGITSFYLRLQSRSNTLALVLRNENAFNKKAIFDLSIFFFLMGALAVLSIYHTFLFLTHRSAAYIYYSLFVGSLLFFTISFTSYHRQILPLKIFGFDFYFWCAGIAASICFLSMYFFSAEILDLFPVRKKSQALNKLKVALAILPLLECIVLFMTFLTESTYCLIPIRILPILQIILLPCASFYLWYKNRKNLIAFFYTVSWLPFALGCFVVSLSLFGVIPQNDLWPWSPSIGAVLQSILLSFAAGQRLNVLTQDKLTEQGEKLRVMSELEVSVKRLENRDRVITSFVSSKIVEELDRGQDPLKYRPKIEQRCILFLDMHDYTNFAEIHSPTELHKILNEYFEAINEITYLHGGQVDKIIGDAMMIVFDEPINCLHAIIKLRRRISEMNRTRFDLTLKPIHFGIGVTFGSMLSANFGSEKKYDRTLVGDAVNIASRLESITRNFYVDVLCSKEFIDQIGDYSFCRPSGYVQLKGRLRKSLVYEIFEHQPDKVIFWKQSTKHKLLEVIGLELGEQYSEALARLHELASRCPPHLNKKDQIMDHTLIAVIRSLEEKMKQLNVPIPSTEELFEIYPGKGLAA